VREEHSNEFTGLNESGWQHAYSFNPSHSLLYLPTIALLRFTASVVGSGNGFVLPLALVALGAVGVTLLLRVRRRL